MTITQVIEALEEVLEQHGDIQVTVEVSEGPFNILHSVGELNADVRYFIEEGGSETVQACVALLI